MLVNVGMVGHVGGVSGGGSGGATGPSLDMDLAGSGALDSRVTFTRAAGPATYFDSSGVLQSAGTNVPRFDYDPVTHAARGLLIEEARTNALLQSGDFTTGSWAKTSCTLATGTLGPNGAVTGSGVISNNAAIGYLGQNYTSVAATTYTASVFAKAGTASSILLLAPAALFTDAAVRTGTYNLTTGLVTGTSGAGASTAILSVGNGWYRCSLTFTPDNAVSAQMQFTRAAANGDGTSIQHYAFGAQIEAGAFATSYIPTTGASAIRAADVATMPTAPASFSRASTATYYNVAGVIQSAAIDVPRYDYDPVTHAPRGLLLEGQRTNVYLQSSDASNAAWPKTSITISAAILAPDGTTTGRGIIGNAGATGYILQNIAVIAGTTYTLSFYAQAGADTQCLLLAQSAMFADATNRVGTFTLTGGGTVASVTGGGATGTIQSVGGGWYRVSLTFTPTLSVTNGAQFRTAVNGNGVATNFSIWGMQAEVGSTPSSYIPTTVAAVTRAADVVTGNWFNVMSGTLAGDYIVDQTTNPSALNRDVVCINDTTVSNRMCLRGQAASTATTHLLGSVAGANTTSATLGSTTASTKMKIAGAWDGTNMVGCLNSGATVSTVKGVPTGITTLTIGNDYSGAALYLNGWISRVRYWPTVLSAADLQSATS